MIQVDYKKVSVEQLPFEDNSFDCIVSTFTFCSISDIEKAIREFYRVLKPGGKLFFLEHGKSKDNQIYLLQILINPIFKRLACNIDRDIEGIINTQKFRILTIKKFYQKDMMKIYGYLYMGICEKA